MVPRPVSAAAKKIVLGAVSGLIYYALYVVLLPALLVATLRVPVETGRAAYYLWFFVALGTAESVLGGHAISIPIRMLSKLLGILVLYSVTNGGVISATISYGGTDMAVEIDASPLLFTVMLVSLVFAAVDAFTCFERES